MVETEQGIKKGISTFLSFSAKSVEPQLLEQLLVGRSDIADLLEKYARQIVTNNQNHQIILIGPRGSGKTHMLRVLFHRLQSIIKNKELIVAYFAEEEYGIASYLDFLIRIINSFKRWYENDIENLEKKLEILRDTSNNRQEFMAEEIITDYIKGKPLLILTENFDDVLNAIKEEGQNSLRAFLYTHNRTSIIATSQSLDPILKKEDKPFYNFFTPIYLKKLTYKDSLALLKQLAAIEGKPELLNHLNGKGKFQIKAIQRLVKGNHRLLVTFFEFLKADSLADLSTIFIKTMNDLKPYFETYIRYLPPLQQKIIHYLALSKTPKRGTEISKYCFIHEKSISKVLSELQRRRLIEATSDPESKRDKLYDIAEPLLRIAIEIGEHKHGITSLFIDFLALYYSEDELIEQKKKFEELYFIESNETSKQKYKYEIEARQQAMQIKVVSTTFPSEALTKKIKELHESKNYSELISLAVKSRLKTSYEYFLLAFAYNEIRDYQKAVKAYEKSLELEPKQFTAWYNLGLVYVHIGLYEKAIEANKRATEINSEDSDAWFNLGNCHIELKQYEDAIKAFERCLNIDSANDAAWNNIGNAFGNTNKLEEALNAHKKSVEINPEKSLGWYNLGYTYSRLNQFEKSNEAYKKTIDLDSQNDNAWEKLGDNYVLEKKWESALDSYKRAVEINAQNDYALASLGMIYILLNNREKAKEVYRTLLPLNLEYAYVGIFNLLRNDIEFIRDIFIVNKDLMTTKASYEIFTVIVTDVLKRQPSKKEIDAFKYIIENIFENKEGLSIAHDFLEVYEKLVLNGQKKALYKLPKEQRDFFEQEILKTKNYKDGS